MDRSPSFESFLEAAPTISELKKHVAVDDEKWLDLGVLLEVESTKLKNISSGSATDLDKIGQMFEIWLDTAPKANRKQLLASLREKRIGKSTIADRYEDYLRKIHETSSMLKLSF
uniref:Death domain-containing protein n=1 Tax=Amphimedon queenslandica TaxID=400682 RepID=A0A1X7SNT8_AMPQE